MRPARVKNFEGEFFGCDRRRAGANRHKDGVVSAPRCRPNTGGFGKAMAASKVRLVGDDPERHENGQKSSPR